MAVSKHHLEDEELTTDDAQQTADEKFNHWVDHGGFHQIRHDLIRMSQGKSPHPQKRWPDRE